MYTQYIDIIQFARLSQQLPGLMALQKEFPCNQNTQIETNLKKIIPKLILPGIEPSVSSSSGHSANCSITEDVKRSPTFKSKLYLPLLQDKFLEFKLYTLTGTVQWQ